MTALDDLKRKVTELEQEVDQLRKEVVIVGTIVPYGGESPPEGWLLCDGRPLKRDEYPRLYEVIAAGFGAPDDSHFCLPDLHGRFVRGVDHGKGRDPDAKGRVASSPGGNTGDIVGSLQEDQLASHAHRFPKPIQVHGRSFKGSSTDDDKPLKDSKGAPYLNETDPVGGSETRPKNVYVNWIIYAGA